MFMGFGVVSARDTVGRARQIIVAISSIVLVLLRRSIRTITNHVAEGTPWLDRGILKPIGSSEVGGVLAKANPLASAILVPDNSPIHSIAQLKGKKIAVAQGSSASPIGSSAYKLVDPAIVGDVASVDYQQRAGA